METEMDGLNLALRVFIRKMLAARGILPNTHEYRDYEKAKGALPHPALVSGFPYEAAIRFIARYVGV